MTFRAQFVPTDMRADLHGQGARYQLGDVIGKGSNCVVMKATQVATGFVRAVKVIKAQSETFNPEIGIMKALDHPNIVKMFESYSDGVHLFVIMEFCNGGSLLDEMLGGGFFTEDKAANLIQQFLRALRFLQRSRIRHGDLHNHQNICLANRSGETILKIIDFDSATRVSAELTDDIFEVGRILKTLLSWGPAMHKRGVTPSLKNLNAVQLDRKAVSSDALSLLALLEESDPRHMLTAADALKHPWFKRVRNRDHNLPRSLPEKLRAYLSMPRLRRLVLHIAVDQLGDDRRLRSAREIWRVLDANHDGLVTPNEVRECLAKCGHPVPKDLAHLMLELDADGVGVLDHTVLLAAVADEKVLDSQTLRAAFEVFDRDHTGGISSADISRVLDGPGAECAAEASAEGAMTFEQFSALVGCSRVLSVQDQRSTPTTAAMAFWMERTTLRDIKLRAKHRCRASRSGRRKRTRRKRTKPNEVKAGGEGAEETDEEEEEQEDGEAEVAPLAWVPFSQTASVCLDSVYATVGGECVADLDDVDSGLNTSNESGQAQDWEAEGDPPPFKSESFRKCHWSFHSPSVLLSRGHSTPCEDAAVTALGIVTVSL